MIFVGWYALKKLLIFLLEELKGALVIDAVLEFLLEELKTRFVIGNELRPRLYGDNDVVTSVNGAFVVFVRQNLLSANP